MPSWVIRLVGRPVFWVTLVSLIAGVSIARAVAWSRRLPPALPVLATVPEFRLVAESGQPYGSDELRGKVWVANFVFTRCPTICPAFTQKMFELQHRGRNLGEAFHLVTFTADPDYDTPERLREFSQKYRASPRMWTFLTGAMEEVRSTVVLGLKVGMGRDGDERDFASIFHGTHFVLVDSEMRIRGYYDSSNADAVDRVLQAVELLANRGF